MLHHTSEITGSLTVLDGSITLTNGTFNGTATSASYATFAETANVDTTHQYDSTSTTSILPRLGTNISSGTYSTVAGGTTNSATATCSYVGGGQSNRASNTASTVSGGQFNCADGAHSTVGGGYSHYNSGFGGTISGGYDNCVINNFSSVGGGCFNRALSSCNFIGGGCNNVINSTGLRSAILGGITNTINCADSFIIGCGITDSASNTVHMNNVCVLQQTRTQTLVETSAKRCKRNVRPLGSQLAKITQLKPVNFNWKKDNTEDIGFIAEDINEIYPDLVSWEENGEIHGVKYTKFTSILVKALQEQQLMIDELKDEVEKLKNRL